jgi:hypothetical protein
VLSTSHSLPLVLSGSALWHLHYILTLSVSVQVPFSSLSLSLSVRVYPPSQCVIHSRNASPPWRKQRHEDLGRREASRTCRHVAVSVVANIHLARIELATFSV